jgi:hypothetical protein
MSSQIELLKGLPTVQTQLGCQVARNAEEKVPLVKGIQRKVCPQGTV